jgi:hypothetical protein
MEPGREEPEPAELLSTRVTRDDGEWIVRVEGRGKAGGSADAGVPLLFLTFARASEPDERVYEAVRVARRLDGLGEAEILSALGEARPYRRDWTRSDLFEGTRRPRGGN